MWGINLPKGAIRETGTVFEGCNRDVHQAGQSGSSLVLLMVYG